jgi:hypothetical protein
MSPNDDTRDEELLARYRQASADTAGPSEAVRAAILAESRRVADELAKRVPPKVIDVSRPAANDSRWKITAFGTIGAALLAALIFAPRYWNTSPEKLSMAPASASAPASTDAQTRAKTEAPQLAEVKPSEASSYTAPARQSSGESNALQDVAVTGARKKSSKSAGAPSLNLAAPAPAAPPPSAAQNYAPLSSSASPLAAAIPATAARVRPLDLSARAGLSNSLAARDDHVVGGLKPATLQSAVTQGDVAQAASLLDQGAVIDARDEAGRTPLMLAVTQDRLEMVRLLLARGADPNAADNAGHTPLQQATKRNLQDVAALLQQAGAH